MKSAIDGKNMQKIPSVHSNLCFSNFDRKNDRKGFELLSKSILILRVAT